MNKTQEPDRQPVNLLDYERLAEERMTAMAFGYYASGSKDEITVAANNQAYNEMTIKAGVIFVGSLIR